MKMLKYIALALMGFLSQPLSAALEIDVTSGNLQPTPIAIPNFFEGSGASSEMCQKITEVIVNDLKNSGLFAPIDPKAFIQDAASLQGGPHFSEWRLIHADTLVSGKVENAGDGNIRVEFRLFDVVREVQIEGKAFSGPEKDWRRMAHKVADAIYKRITTDEGYFDTKIIYVARTQQGKKRSERLAVMDQDGANNQYITEGASLVLTPRFSPDMNSITYIDFGPTKVARVYVMNLKTRQRMLMGDFKGMTFAPRFSPDGNKLVMSYAENGITSIFEFDLANKKIRRLTQDPVIDTSPCYSPDGSRIVFNSDRAGQTQLYVMPASGGSPERISFGSGSYRTPVWSPRGDLIAFTKIARGQFYIGVMRPDGSGERLIAQGYVVESPSWAPNGRMLIYTKEEKRGSPKLCVIDVTGHNERDLNTPQGAVHGSWSPLIP